MTGSSLISTTMKCSSGIYFPSTTRQTVIGVAIIRPAGPHSQVQKAIDTRSATLETPALWP